jgi:putative flippase GtrA
MFQNHKIIKFIISGGLAAVTEYSIFIVLYTFVTQESSLIICQTISFLAGFIVSFLLNKHWVFSSTGKARDELVRYGILAIINLVLTNILIWLFINGFGINYWISKLCIMAMVATWNYVIFSKLIFKKTS